MTRPAGFGPPCASATGGERKRIVAPVGPAGSRAAAGTTMASAATISARASRPVVRTSARQERLAGQDRQANRVWEDGRRAALLGRALAAVPVLVGRAQIVLAGPPAPGSGGGMSRGRRDPERA